MAQRAAPADLVFLPYPRSIERREGEPGCVIDLATRLLIGGQAGAETMFAAGTVRDAIRETVGIEVPITPLVAAAGDRPIRLVLQGRDDGGADAAGRVTEDLGAEGYVLTVGAGGVTVVAATEAGLYYGAQTLIQVIQQAGRRLPALRIADAPVLPNRGLMLDVSRSKVPTRETLEKLVRRLSHYKYNQLQLYIEHTFASREHPSIAPDVGGLTPNDLLHLDALCRQHHIDLVPNWQSLGHQRTMLENPRYAHLAETDWRWSFASTSDEAFETVEEIYADLLPNFSSKYFNIDADEPWDMGLGVSKARTDEIGAGRVYIEHIRRLHEIVSRHGRTMMMWADVFWHYPELVGELPDDIVLLDWWYEPKERYDTVGKLQGRRFYVCPGTGAWLSLFPRVERAIVNVQGFVRDGVAAGAEGMLMTDWGDYGHFTMFENTWYLYLWAAECGWNGAQTPIEDYDVAVSRLFYHDLSGRLVAAVRALGEAIAPLDGDVRTNMVTGAMFWGDPLDRRATKVMPPERMAAIRDAAEAIFPLLDGVRDPAIRHELGFSALQLTVLAERYETFTALVEVLDAARSGGAPADATVMALDDILARLEAQRRQIPVLSEEFLERWHGHARHSEVGVSLDRFARQADQYRHAMAWVRQQRDRAAGGGEVSGIDAYDSGGYLGIMDEVAIWVGKLADVVGLENLSPDIRGYIEASRGELES